MTLIESILKELQNLPASKLVEVARYVHSLDETAQKVKLLVLQETHGALSDTFETALANSRRH